MHANARACAGSSIPSLAATIALRALLSLSVSPVSFLSACLLRSTLPADGWPVDMRSLLPATSVYTVLYDCCTVWVLYCMVAVLYGCCGDVRVPVHNTMTHHYHTTL